jgi:8-oxo-dGTP diphosphatase
MDIRWRRAAAYVLCWDERRRLLLTRFASAKHPDHGKWTMPGGGMEWGESPEGTALRELEEETGLDATIGPVLGIFSRWFEAQEAVMGGAGHSIGIVYTTAHVRGQLRTDFEGTTDAARWFTIDEVRALDRVELIHRL